MVAASNAERAKVAELEGAADLLAQVLISVDAFGIVLQTSLGESANRLCRALWVNRPAIWRDRCVHVEGSPQRRDNDTLRADLKRLKGVLAGANRKSTMAKNRHDYMELLYERDDLIIEHDTLRADLVEAVRAAREAHALAVEGKPSMGDRMDRVRVALAPVLAKHGPSGRVA